MLGKALTLASAGNAGAESDDDFASTVLLLHGDGTNGAQNNTFLDSSTNNFTITRNGNTTQGSFSPFSKPDGGWGNFFNGSTDLLTTPTGQTNLTLGTSDFTIEGFFYPTTQVQSNPSLFASSSDVNLANTILVQFNSSTNEIVLFVNNVHLTASSTNNYIVLNTWNHIAVCRTGGDTYTFYINGTLVDNVATNSTSLTTNAWRIGYWTVNGNQYTGYMNSFRIIKGTALYTGGSLTVPTSPLTAVANTQLLTCQSNRFIDNSSNGYAITLSGTPKVTPFSPFPLTTEYSPSVNGGSGYFDGSGDDIRAGASNLGSSNFTIEGWFYPTSLAAQSLPIYSTISGVKTDVFAFSFQAGGSVLIYASTGTPWNILGGSAAGTIILNTWNHVAVTRSGSTFNGYVNGVRGFTASNASAIGTLNGFSIGSPAISGFDYQGYISDVRQVVGTALYTGATFTPPTAPLTAITNTSLLCNFTNAGIFDNTGFNNLETVGNAQIDTTTKKYGTGSMKFDGTGDGLFIPSTQDLTFGTGDFTIECWFNTNTTSATSNIYDPRTTANQVVPVIYRNGTSLAYFVNGSNRITGGTITTGTWYHIAVSKESGSTKMFLDGTQIGSTYTDANNYIQTAVYIGRNWAASGVWNGYIDDLRITKGVARYTTTFTPPDKAFPNIGA